MVIARTKSGPAVASRGTVDKALFRCACVLTLPQWGIAAGTDVPERRFSFVTFPTVHRVSTLRRVAREAHRQARTCATQVPGVRRTRWIGSPSPYLRTTRPRKVQRPSRFVFSVSLGGRPNTKEVRRLSNGQAPTRLPHHREWLETPGWPPGGSEQLVENTSTISQRIRLFRLRTERAARRSEIIRRPRFT